MLKTCKLIAFALAFGLSGVVALPSGSNVVFNPGAVAWADDCPPDVEDCIKVTAPRRVVYPFPLSPMGILLELERQLALAAWEAKQAAIKTCEKAKSDAVAAGAIASAIMAGAATACAEIPHLAARATCAAAVSAAITSCLLIEP